MYQLQTASLGALATTGAVLAQSWVAAWTLFVAGLAMLTIARVLRKRRELVPAPVTLPTDDRASEPSPVSTDGPDRS